MNLRTILSILTATASILLVSSTTALAAPVLGGPADGARLATPLPKFTWTVPAGEVNVRLVIAPTKVVATDGTLRDADIQSPTAPGATSFQDLKEVYTPGDYFWQLNSDNGSASQETYQYFTSPIRRFVVPAIFQFSRLRPVVEDNAANGMNEIALTGKLRCNVTKITSVTMLVYRGTKLLHNDTREVGCYAWEQNNLFHNFQPRPGQIPNGTPLRIVMVAKSGIFRSPLTTLRLTWRS
ncbi:MAG: hypothetical protein JWM98_1910 [Thermoleophilia bacterium]|nr:hypothetical protein [Thermoleophilia bacterium]